MRKVFWILILMHSAGNMFSQVGFISSWSDSLEQDPIQIVEAWGGGSVIMGITGKDSFPNLKDLFCVKYNVAGGVEWAYSYPIVGHQQGMGLHSLSEEGYLITATSDSSGHYAGQILIIRLNRNGIPTAAQMMSQAGKKFRVFGSTVTSEGKIVIGGQQEVVPASNGLGLTVMLNANGIPDWAYLWDSTVSAFHWPTETPNGAILFSGRHSFPGYNGHITHLSKDGTWNWSNHYPMYVQGQDDFFGKLKTMSDGRIVVGGEFNAPSPRFYDGFLLATDSVGNPDWIRAFNYSGLDASRGKDLEIDSQDRIWLHADHGGCFGAGSGTLFRCTSSGILEEIIWGPRCISIAQDGDVLYALEYSDSASQGRDIKSVRFDPDVPVTCLVTSIPVTRDSIFPQKISFTPTRQPINFDITPLNIQANALPTAFNVECQIMVSQPESVIQVEPMVYPNPSQGNFRIEYPGKFDVILMDLTGKTLHMENGTDKLTLKASELPNGIYFLRISPNSGSHFTRKIIISH